MIRKAVLAAVAAASVAGAAALRFELETGPRPSGESSQGSAPTLDVSQDQERMRPRSRLVEIREARLSPRRVTAGGKVVATARLVSVGSLPVRGPITIEADVRTVSVPFGPLAPGEEVLVRAEFVARANVRARIALSADEGPFSAAPFVVGFHVAGASATAKAQVVSPLQHVPGLEIEAVDVGERLRLEVVVENTGTDEETSGVVRLTGSGGESLVEQEIPRLAPGARATIALRPPGARVRRAPGILHAVVEAVRRPAGFRETIEDRWPLVLDPPPDPGRRDGARR